MQYPRLPVGIHRLGDGGMTEPGLNHLRVQVGSDQRRGVEVAVMRNSHNRHTCATLLAALDVYPRVAMRILRHAQIDVTMNVYTEVSDAKTLNALRRLGRQLGS